MINGFTPKHLRVPLYLLRAFRVNAKTNEEESIERLPMSRLNDSVQLRSDL